MAIIERVLFFCTGNIWKNPFAHYFSNWLKENEFKEILRDVEFRSVKV